MKKVLFTSLFVLAMVLGIGTVAQASSSFFQSDLEPVSFWVLNGSDDDTVQLMVSSTPTTVGTGLEYSVNQTNWFEANTIDMVSIDILGEDDRELVYWKFNGNNVADLTFFDGNDDDLWDSVTIYWDDISIELSFVVPVCGDSVAPVPIPASALLLGSGMVGLIAFGKRVRKRVF